MHHSYCTLTWQKCLYKALWRALGIVTDVGNSFFLVVSSACSEKFAFFLPNVNFDNQTLLKVNQRDQAGVNETVIINRLNGMNSLCADAETCIEYRDRWHVKRRISVLSSAQRFEKWSFVRLCERASKQINNNINFIELANVCEWRGWDVSRSLKQVPSRPGSFNAVPPVTPYGAHWRGIFAAFVSVQVISLTVFPCCV